MSDNMPDEIWAWEISGDRSYLKANELIAFEKRVKIDKTRYIRADLVPKLERVEGLEEAVDSVFKSLSLGFKINKDHNKKVVRAAHLYAAILAAQDKGGG